MNFLKNLLRVFYTLNHSTIVIFPGFGMHPSNYEQMFPENADLIYLDIWNDSEFQNIKQGFKTGEITPPGTPKYDIWFSKIVEQCRERIESERTNNEKIIYFAHSIGAEICNDLYENADAVITYGFGKQFKKIDNVPIFHLLGTLDAYISSKLDEWPKGFIPILNGDHFSCSNEAGKLLAEKWRSELGIPKINEYTQNNFPQAKILVKNEINKIIDSLNSRN